MHLFLIVPSLYSVPINIDSYAAIIIGRNSKKEKEESSGCQEIPFFVLSIKCIIGNKSEINSSIKRDNR